MTLSITTAPTPSDIPNHNYATDLEALTLAFEVWKRAGIKTSIGRALPASNKNNDARIYFDTRAANYAFSGSWEDYNRQMLNGRLSIDCEFCDIKSVVNHLRNHGFLAWAADDDITRDYTRVFIEPRMTDNQRTAFKRQANALTQVEKSHEARVAIAEAGAALAAITDQTPHTEILEVFATIDLAKYQLKDAEYALKHHCSIYGYIGTDWMLIEGRVLVSMTEAEILKAIR